jgi:signal transduction histidine kinase
MVEARANVALMVEESLRRTNRALRMVNRCNEAVARAQTESELFTEICKAVVETGGYKMCWVGLAVHDERKSVKPVASAGDERGYLSSIKVEWRDSPLGQGPTGSALRTGNVTVFGDFETDPRFAPWREVALKHGFRASTGLPLIHGGHQLGVITMYSGEPESFDESELDLLRRLSASLSFGVRALRDRAELLHSQKMEAIGRLAGGVAHDVNNILSVILSLSEVCRLGLPATHAAQSDLKEISRAGLRAGELTRQLLAFSRKQLLKLEAIDLNEAVRGVEPMLRRLLTEDIAFVLELAPGLDHVKADRGQLEQVLVNLAVNARDAMPHGGTLTITTKKAQPTEDVPLAAVALTVGDTGTGIAPELQERIFEPFFTTKPAGKGTGLGLSTVYGIVTQSGGRVSVQSTPGVGATFTVVLPRHEQAPVAPRAPAPLRARAVGQEAVLVVEDDEFVREIARRVLAEAGYTVHTAASAEEALQRFETPTEPLSLVLSDVVMPGLSGPALVERLKRARPSLRALFMSGYPDDEIIQHGGPASHGPLIAKPLTPSVLLQQVALALGVP